MEESRNSPEKSVLEIGSRDHFILVLKRRRQKHDRESVTREEGLDVGGERRTYEVELVESTFEVLNLFGSEERLRVESSFLGVGKSSVRDGHLEPRNVLQLDVRLVPASRKETEREEGQPFGPLAACITQVSVQEMRLSTHS